MSSQNVPSFTKNLSRVRSLCAILATSMLTTLWSAATWAQTNSHLKGPDRSQYSKLVVFGDGLSDQGIFGRLTANRYPPSPPFENGRWTNGPTWVEHLSRISGWPLAELDNHAQGGATTGHYNINEPLRSALGLGAYAPIRGVRAQIDAALRTTPKLDPRALYVVWAGGHDIGAYLDYGQPDIKAHSPAANIRAGIEALKSAGAKHVLLGTMPDMGATPGYAGTAKASQATALVKDYNLEINHLAQNLRSTGMHITLLDGEAAFADAAKRVSQRGVKQFSEAFLPLDYVDFQNPLAPAKPLPEGRIADEYFSFWAVSASAKVHEALGAFAYELLAVTKQIQTGSPAVKWPSPQTIDTRQTPLHALHGGPGQAAFWVTSSAGVPDVAVISLKPGQVQAPYSSDDGRTRLATVLKGHLSFANGSTVNRGQERIYRVGETLLIPPNVPFWAAARKGTTEVLIQILRPDTQIAAATVVPK